MKDEQVKNITSCLQQRIMFLERLKEKEGNSIKAVSMEMNQWSLYRHQQGYIIISLISHNDVQQIFRNIGETLTLVFAGHIILTPA